MSRKRGARTMPGAAHDQEQQEESANGYRLSQVVESGAFVVEVRRELLALEIAAQLSATIGQAVEAQTVVPLKSNRTLGVPTFRVCAVCSFEEMQDAIRRALFECISFDAGLVHLGLWQFAS